MTDHLEPSTYGRIPYVLSTSEYPFSPVSSEVGEPSAEYPGGARSYGRQSGIPPGTLLGGTPSPHHVRHVRYGRSPVSRGHAVTEFRAPSTALMTEHRLYV